ncbi:MAG: outer membrane protein transport protein [Planctomycetes bacterium]|nr:outer membrane protein transport protein [Planctomycetota bacterium]
MPSPTKSTIGAALALLLLSGVASATNGPKLIALGARSAGRAGVDYAYADDGIGPATNPAGMGFVVGNRLDNNWALFDPQVTWTNSFGSFSDKDDLFIPVPAFSFGAVFDPTASWRVKSAFDMGRWGLVDAEGKEIPPEPIEDWDSLSEDEKTFGGRLRFGIGVFPITGGKVQITDMLTSGFAQPVDWETDILTVSLTPSLAYRFNKYISIGMNLQIIYSKFELDGGIAQPSSVLRDDFEFAAGILSVNPQIVTEADIDDAFSYGVSGRLGIMLQPFDQLTIGIVYQERTYTADYLGRTQVNANDEIQRLTNGNAGLLQVIDPGINPALGFSGEYDLRIQDYEQPRQVGLGFAFRPHPRVSLGFDYTFIDWSMLRRFKARLSNGNNPNLDILTSRTIHVRIPLNFKDQHVVALSATVLVARGEDLVENVPKWAFIMRGGYNYAASPVPSNATLPQLPVINEHHVALGFSFQWGPQVEFNFAWEWQLPNTINTGTHIGDFTLSNSSQEVEIMAFHLGLGVNF